MAVTFMVLRRMAANDELEPPYAAWDCAPCAHNGSGAHGALRQLSWPLQALVRRKWIASAKWSP